VLVTIATGSVESSGKLHLPYTVNGGDMIRNKEFSALKKIVLVTLLVASCNIWGQQDDPRVPEVRKAMYTNCMEQPPSGGGNLTQLGQTEVCKCVSVVAVDKILKDQRKDFDDVIAASKIYCMSWAQKKQASLPDGAFFNAPSSTADVPNNNQQQSNFGIQYPSTSNLQIGGMSCSGGSGGLLRCDNGVTCSIGGGLARCSNGFSASTDQLGLTRFSDGTTATTNGGGLTRFNNGRTCDTDRMGLTRCSDGTICSTDKMGLTRCNK
jgi:hypothetical protein